MFVLVSGGAGSGKSAFAEDVLLSLPAACRVYLATMQVGDDEGMARVARHRQLRADKDFQTMERPRDIGGADFPPHATVLLEDLSNLAANEFFGPAGRRGTQARLLDGLDQLRAKAEHLVVVTNELFSDGMDYPAETAEYLGCLANLNRALAARADAVYEVVCGIPVCRKGRDN